MEDRPEYIHIEYRKMDGWRQFARVIQYFLYTFFASFWFYFVPWTSLVLSYYIPIYENPDYFDEEKCCNLE